MVVIGDDIAFDGNDSTFAIGRRGLAGAVFVLKVLFQLYAEFIEFSFSKISLRGSNYILH